MYKILATFKLSEAQHNTVIFFAKTKIVAKKTAKLPCKSKFKLVSMLVILQEMLLVASMQCKNILP